MCAAIPAVLPATATELFVVEPFVKSPLDMRAPQVEAQRAASPVSRALRLPNTAPPSVETASACAPGVCSQECSGIASTPGASCAAAGRTHPPVQAETRTGDAA